MRTTTAMLSMLLLAGGLYASDVRAAQNSTCDCVSACGRTFDVCSADAVVAQKQAKLACRFQEGQNRITCAAERCEALDSCKESCGPDFSACAHQAIDDQTACVAPLHSTLMDCLDAATVDYRNDKQDCKAEQQACAERCK